MSGGASAYRDVTTFARELLIALERGSDHAVLRQRVAEAAIDLVTQVVRAFEDDGAAAKAALPAEFRGARVLLVLARDVGVLADSDFRAAAQRLDAVAKVFRPPVSS